MSSGFSLPIQVVRAGNITAWLVQDESVPVVSLAWSWPGGEALEAAEHAGATELGAGLLTEGAGDLRAAAFADASAIRPSARSSTSPAPARPPGG